MASNNYTSANVVPSSDTFREWVDLTNRITYDMEKVVVTTVANTQGACTSGNAYVNGFFSANTLLVEDTLKGVGATGSVYGTKAAAATAGTPIDIINVEDDNLLTGGDDFGFSETVSYYE